MRILRCFLLSLCLFVTALSAGSGLAGTFLSSDEAGGFLSVPVKGDLYVAGGKVVVEEAVQGDLATGGGTVIVNGKVEQDLLAAGGSVIVNGIVEDDIRAVAGDITIFSDVGGDLIVFGGSVTLGSRATVRGDLIAAAGQVVIDGTVNGQARINGGKTVLNGTVLGNSAIRSAERLELNGHVRGKTKLSSAEVILGPGASFGGDVEYWTPVGTLDFSGVRLNGEATFNPDLKPVSKLHRDIKFRKKHAAGFLGVWFLLSTLTGALSIFVLLLLPRRWYTLAVGSLRDSFWRSLGLGLLYFIITPIAATIFMATVVGIPLGLFLISVLLFSLLSGKVLTSIVIARWIERRRFRQWGRAATFFISLALYVMLKMLTLVPFAGWAVLLILVCAVYGSCLNAVWTANT